MIIGEMAFHLVHLVSKDTIGYIYKKPSKKPKLSLNRFRWAKSFKHYSFKDVIFTDECAIWQYSEPNMAWVKKEQEAMFEAQAHPAKVNVYGTIVQEKKFAQLLSQEI